MKKIKKKFSEVLKTFENVMENEAFAPKEQMLHFPEQFQIHDVPKPSKGVIMELWLNFLFKCSIFYYFFLLFFFTQTLNLE